MQGNGSRGRENGKRSRKKGTCLWQSELNEGFNMEKDFAGRRIAPSELIDESESTKMIMEVERQRARAGNHRREGGQFLISSSVSRSDALNLASNSLLNLLQKSCLGRLRFHNCHAFFRACVLGGDNSFASWLDGMTTWRRFAGWVVVTGFRGSPVAVVMPWWIWKGRLEHGPKLGVEEPLSWVPISKWNFFVAWLIHRQ
ncbi:hypothetical protein ACLOJK_000397 [Asimina triloba]